MKKLLNIIFLICASLIMILPLIFVNKSIEGISQLENRKLYKLPQFIINNKVNDNYYLEFEEWYKDHVGFREKMMKLNARILMKGFHRTVSDKVVLGKDDWLFYKGEDEVSIKEYKGQYRLNEDKLRKILDNINTLNNWCNNNNIKFVLMLIPDKEEIYSEYLPGNIYEFHKEKNVDLAYNFIKNNSDVNVIFIKNDLLDEKKEHQVFKKYDSHWNNYGAYIGYKCLQKALDHKVRAYDEFSPHPYTALSGDLAGMTLVNDMFRSYEDNEIVPSTDSKLIYKSDKPTKFEIYENKKASGSIFVMGDSFRELLLNYLNFDYKDAYYVHRYENNFSDVLKYKPDILVYQLVERYVDELTKPIDLP